MQVSVNGEPKALEGVVTVAELLQLYRLTPERVAVEVNERLVRRGAYAQTQLSVGDRVEIVTLVGGG